MSGEADLPAKLGRYELITRIGQGGMADVQLALQRGPAGFEKLVVVKLVHPKLASEQAFVEMLLDEARVAAMLKHPNVVDIYDLGEVEGRYFIAMEYLEGEPLLAVLRAGRDGERLDVSSTARLIADTAEGLDAAHELRSMAGKPMELVHHDVSLGNIVVLYNGHVKLVDFGVAKATQSVSTRAKVQGKYSYMAPEKLKGSAGDRRSDIFSLGCVLWEALTLRRLFKGSNDEETMKQVLEGDIPLPSKVNADVKEHWDAIVMKALSRDENTRYATAKELADDLEDVLHKEGYSRNNKLIATFMQKTFKEHIEARKKLLQEVSSKGTASTEILEAAFVREPMTIAATNDRGEFTINFNNRQSNPSMSGMAPSGMPGTPAFPAAKGTPAELADPSAIRARLETPTGSKPLADASFPIAEASADETLPVGTGVSARRDRKRLMIAGGIALALILIAIIATSLGGSTPPVASVKPIADGAVRIGSSAGSAEKSVPVVVVDAAVAVVAIDATEEIEMGSDVGSGSGSDTGSASAPRTGSGSGGKTDGKRGSGAPTTKTDPTPKANPEELYKQGVQAFTKGDNKTALDFLRRAQKANPGYAPTWRVLGLVYERLAEFPQARIAFLQYLKLAPNASDAASTRAKLDKLGK